MRFFLTGDTHGNFTRIKSFCNKFDTAPERDVMIVLGDAGLNFYGGQKDMWAKYKVSKIPITLFCIHGNHEMRPSCVRGYKTKDFCGGKVWYEDSFPNILFAKDGEIYHFGDSKCLVIGGAYSVDKWFRLATGWYWFENEQPDDNIKSYVEKQLEENGNKIDVILSHTCPLKYEPTEVFLGFIDQSTVDKTTEQWLDRIEEKTEYGEWYCGHFHISKSIDRMRFMYEDIIELHGDGEYEWET